MDQILRLIQEGITVNVAFDVESAIILGAVLFVAIALALTFHAKVIS